jgi:hypothetical protein
VGVGGKLKGEKQIRLPFNSLLSPAIFLKI